MGRSYVVCIGSKDAVNFNALPMRCCSKFAQARYLLRPLSPHALAFFGNTYPIVQGIPLVNGEVLPLEDFWILNCCLTPSSRIQHTLRSEFTLVFPKNVATAIGDRFLRLRIGDSFHERRARFSQNLKTGQSILPFF